MKQIRLLVFLLICMVLLSGTSGNVQANELEPETPNPIIAYLSGVTGLAETEIVSYQESGFGLGQIAKAYYLISLQGEGEYESVLTQAVEMGWGELYKSLGYHPSEKKGLGWLFKDGEKPGNKPEEIGPPDHANNDKDKETGPPDHANNDKDKETGPPDHANNDKDKEKEKK